MTRASGAGKVPEGSLSIGHAGTAALTGPRERTELLQAGTKGASQKHRAGGLKTLPEASCLALDFGQQESHRGLFTHWGSPQASAQTLPPKGRCSDLPHPRPVAGAPLPLLLSAPCTWGVSGSCLALALTTIPSCACTWQVFPTLVVSLMWPRADPASRGHQAC